MIARDHHPAASPAKPRNARAILLSESVACIDCKQPQLIVIRLVELGEHRVGPARRRTVGPEPTIESIAATAKSTDHRLSIILRIMIDLARNMRMDIVAEGVESFEQVVLLRDLGIQAAQGYVFAPPLPASSFLQLIEAIDPLPQATVGQGEGDAPPPAVPNGRFAAA